MWGRSERRSTSTTTLYPHPPAPFPSLPGISFPPPPFPMQEDRSFCAPIRDDVQICALSTRSYIFASEIWPKNIIKTQLLLRTFEFSFSTLLLFFEPHFYGLMDISVGSSLTLSEGGRRRKTDRVGGSLVAGKLANFPPLHFSLT